MKEVTINQCDFCKKSSFSKSVIIRHEKTCFHNTPIKSCQHVCFPVSTMLLAPFMCLLGVGAKLNSKKHEFKPTCSRWIHIDLIDYLDDYDHARGELNDASRVLNLIARITKSETCISLSN